MKPIEEQIRQAIKDGKFSDLPGKGKPLKLVENPFEEHEWRLANHILRNGGFTLPWIETRQQIEKDIILMHKELKNAWLWRIKSKTASEPENIIESEWHRALEKFKDKAYEINKLISKYNLEVPSEQFQLLPINIDKEINRLTAYILSDTL
jgi:DnaJ family protein C protein 28